MSGHSKWETIKRKKAVNDAKKGKIFSKLSVLITHAARQGGGDIDANPSLRLLVSQAKEEGFPAENVQKAIDKGTGNAQGEQYHSAVYEGFGPCGVQLVVDVLSSNTNRAVAELRTLFSDIGGNMGDSGSVMWNFETKGLVKVKPVKKEKSTKYGEDDIEIPVDKEELELGIMDIPGVEDMQETEDGYLEIYCDFKQLANVRDGIISLGVLVLSSEMVRLSNIKKELSPEEYEKVLNGIEKLEDYEDVQNVWTDAVEKS